MNYCLKTDGLTKKYRNFTALDHLNMHVEQGAIYGLIGKNGAGKTTLIRIICGLQLPTLGSYTLYGVKNNYRDISAARRRMGAVVETPSVYLDLTAEDNLRQQFRVLGLPDDDAIDELLDFVGLPDTGGKKAKNFSLGMRQRLGIAVALAGSPDFIVLDEPINGLDPQGIVEIRELILRLNRERRITVLISSHILGELSKLATHYGFLDKGRLVREISAKDLEEACRKCLRVTVTDASALARVLDTFGVDYKVVSATEAEIYGEIGISDLSLALGREDVKLIKAYERDEDLETYFINLVGGGVHA